MRSMVEGPARRVSETGTVRNVRGRSGLGMPSTRRLPRAVPSRELCSEEDWGF
jgi:hypothetical protein